MKKDLDGAEARHPEALQKKIQRKKKVHHMEKKNSDAAGV